MPFIIFFIFTLLSCQGKSNKQIEYLPTSRSSVIFTLSPKANNETFINISSSFSVEPDLIRLDSLHFIDSAVNISGQIVFSFGEIGNSAYSFEYSAYAGDSIYINYDSKGFPYVKVFSPSNKSEVLQNLYYNINKNICWRWIDLR
jgi:hypothetical protein